jgi:hypothetical protein
MAQAPWWKPSCECRPHSKEPVWCSFLRITPEALAFGSARLQPRRPHSSLHVDKEASAIGQAVMTLPLIARILDIVPIFSLERGNGNGESSRCSHKPFIIACQFDALTATQQKGDRSEMQGVECAHGNGKRLESSFQDGGRQLD